MINERVRDQLQPESSNELLKAVPFVVHKVLEQLFFQFQVGDDLADVRYPGSFLSVPETKGLDFVGQV